jgi:hypothetical protein
MVKKIIDKFTDLPISAHDKWLLRNPNWVWSNRNKSVRKCQRNLRFKVIELLGGKCNNPDCPIPREIIDKRALQVDHINGGGCKEFKAIGAHGVYRRVLKHPEDYQLLCVYCNWIKRYIKPEDLNI